MAPKLRPRTTANSRKETKKSSKKNHVPQEKFDDATASNSMGLIYPSGDNALLILLAARFFSVYFSHITDCDETYNYWEPSHFLLYQNGQQTWEYSPQYALRSYVYLLIHMVPAKVLVYIFNPNPKTVFYFVRCLLAVGCSLSEVYFYKNVCREFGIHIARVMLAFLVFSAGMFISSAAFLPSSFSMCLSTLAIGAWFGRKYELAIFATALSALLGWPFAALLGLPIAVDMLYRRKDWFRFIQWTVISAVVILIPMIWIDSIYYGKLVIAPLNILMYNVFTPHGPNIYGTEPFSFYFFNAFLNFNFNFIASLACPAYLFLCWNTITARPRHRSCLPYWYSLAPLYLWYLVFFLQPHKEERFLFPVYPLICLHAAITVDVIQKLYFFTLTKIHNHANFSHYLQCSTLCMAAAITLSGFLGVSRSVALYKGYSAPMDIMTAVNNLGTTGQVPHDIPINFCVGKEWHRFPSSFFFPSDNWKLRFLKSEFKGQLPQPYADDVNATSIIQPNFNDANQEEPSRYFDIEKCHFIVDLNVGKETIREPNYSRQTNRWTMLSSSKFLDAENSHMFFRAFYIPFVSDSYCTYGSYNLLKSTKLKLLEPKDK